MSATTTYEDGHWHVWSARQLPGVTAAVNYETDNDGNVTVRQLIIDASASRKDFTQQDLRRLDLARQMLTLRGATWQLNLGGRYRLRSMPPKGELTDNFLKNVVRAYWSAANQGLAPAPTIASDTGANVRTVRSWVHKARQRGFMPPGRAGQVV